MAVWLFHKQPYVTRGALSVVKGKYQHLNAAQISQYLLLQANKIREQCSGLPSAQTCGDCL
jgi:hypothetical protein